MSNVNTTALPISPVVSGGLRDLVYPALSGDRLIPAKASDGPGHELTITIPAMSVARHHKGALVVAQAESAGEHAATAAPAGKSVAAEQGTAAADSGAAGASEEPTTYQFPKEIPTFFTLAEAATGRIKPEHGQRGEPAEYWFINPCYTIAVCIVLVIVIRRGLRRPNIERPGFLQNMIEALMGGIYTFFYDVLGGGAKFIPYVGALFLFIWFNNMVGLLPFCKAPTSAFQTTAPLGLITFCYVHYSAIKEGGILNWIKHLRGDPWWMCPIMIPLHIVGELIKPVSLSLRLFGNLLGEDKLLAAFLGMGMLIASIIGHTPKPIIGIPLHFPFFFLSLLTCTIQALVFSMLAAIYIVLLLPHDGGHEHEHDDVNGGQLVSDHGHTAVHDMPTVSPIG